MLAVRINNEVLNIREYKSQRVIIFSDVDRVHKRPDGTARRTFNENKEHQISNIDFFEVDQPNEIRTLGIERPQGGTPNKVVLLTESGYLMLVKSFTDDLAWEVQRQLVNTYFRAKEMNQSIEVLRQVIREELANAGISFGAMFKANVQPAISFINQKQEKQLLAQVKASLFEAKKNTITEVVEAGIKIQNSSRKGKLEAMTRLAEANGLTLRTLYRHIANYIHAGSDFLKPKVGRSKGQFPSSDKEVINMALEIYQKQERKNVMEVYRQVRKFAMEKGLTVGSSHSIRRAIEKYMKI